MKKLIKYLSYLKNNKLRFFNEYDYIILKKKKNYVQ